MCAALLAWRSALCVVSNYLPGDGVSQREAAQKAGSQRGEVGLGLGFYVARYGGRIERGGICGVRHRWRVVTGEVFDNSRLLCNQEF